MTEIDSLGIEVPIKKEEKVRQDRQMTVNGTKYQETREVTELQDNGDNDVKKVVLTRQIGSMVHQTVQVTKNGASVGRKTHSKLSDEDLVHFNQDWSDNWKTRYSDREAKQDRLEMGL